MAGHFMKLAFVCLLGVRSTVALQTAPALPYESPGACPFECCTYRTWTVEAHTELLRQHRRVRRAGTSDKREPALLHSDGVNLG